MSCVCANKKIYRLTLFIIQSEPYQGLLFFIIDLHNKVENSAQNILIKFVSVSVLVII
jgi:hypothetical protein